MNCDIFLTEIISSEFASLVNKNLELNNKCVNCKHYDCGFLICTILNKCKPVHYTCSMFDHYISEKDINVPKPKTLIKTEYRCYGNTYSVYIVNKDAEIFFLQYVNFFGHIQKSESESTEYISKYRVDFYPNFNMEEVIYFFESFKQ